MLWVTFFKPFCVFVFLFIFFIFLLIGFLWTFSEWTLFWRSRTVFVATHLCPVCTLRCKNLKTITAPSWTQQAAQLPTWCFCHDEHSFIMLKRLNNHIRPGSWVVTGPKFPLPVAWCCDLAIHKKQHRVSPINNSGLVIMVDDKVSSQLLLPSCLQKLHQPVPHCH